MRIDNIKNFLLVNKFNLMLIIIYLIIAILTMFHHEIWRDEAQVWCLARDLNIIDVFKAASIEGHPILWYLLVIPFAKLGLPVMSMQILSLLLVFSAVVFFLFKSPFNNFFKAIFIFGAGMLYYIPIIARNYAIIPLLIFLIAYFYKNRTQKPYIYSLLIILMTQTHALMFGFSAILFALFSIEKFKEYFQIKKYNTIIPIVIMAINFVLAGLTFYNAAEQNTSVIGYMEECPRISANLIHFSIDMTGLVPYLIHWYILFYFALAFIAYVFFKSDKKVFGIYFASFVYIITILCKVWYGGITYQKPFLFFLIIVFCIWVLKSENKLPNNQSDNKIVKIFNYIIFCLLLLGINSSINAIRSDYFHNFSGAKEMANYINKNIDSNTLIYMGKSYAISPLSAYMPNKKIYSYFDKEFITFHHFANMSNKEINIPEEKYLITFDEYKDFDENDIYDLIFINSTYSRTGENFNLFKIRKKL